MVGTHSEFPSTDFAITSVNVPDRLDQREFDDRKLQDEASFYARRRWRSALRIWSRRLLPYLMLLAVLGLAGSWLPEQPIHLGHAAAPGWPGQHAVAGDTRSLGRADRFPV